MENYPECFSKYHGEKDISLPLSGAGMAEDETDFGGLSKIAALCTFV